MKKLSYFILVTLTFYICISAWYLDVNIQNSFKHMNANVKAFVIVLYTILLLSGVKYSRKK